MISNPIIFYLASICITLFAVLALFAKNVVYSLLSAIVVFFFGALFFYVLGSEYNAIIQAAIYGFAVPIIIGISIMFTSKEKIRQKSFVVPYLIVMCSIIFILAFTYLIMMSLAMSPDTFNIMDLSQVNAFDTLRIFARSIYIDYVWAFELVSLLLLVVIAGIGITKKRGK